MSARSWLTNLAGLSLLLAIGYAGSHMLKSDPEVFHQDFETAGAKSQNLAIQPLEMPLNLDLEKAKIGRTLFADRRLSKSNTISCQSCHDFAKGGADGRQFAVGINGALGQINAPTVLNSGFNFRQFWNGRAENLNDQVAGPIHNPIEMGSNWPEIVEKLSGDIKLAEQFQLVFHAPLSAVTITQALVEFERSLVTLNSPFDRYARGETHALTEAQLRGYHKFDQFGCVACHQGQNVGGNMFQTMGVAYDYFADRGGHLISDEGRFAITKLPQDLHVFKVPSLRNVELTAPYFHDGSEPSLENAVRKMAKYQLGRVLETQDITDIVDFLRSLTGERPLILKIGEAYGTAEK